MPTRPRTTPAAKPAVKATVKPPVKAPAKATPVAKRPAAKAMAPAASKPIKSITPSKPIKPLKATKPTKPAKLDKPAKVRRKPIRDSFTMPEADFALIATLKARTLSAQREVKKSELLRAGLHALAAMPTPALVAAIAQLEPVKIGRPKKD